MGKINRKDAPIPEEDGVEPSLPDQPRQEPSYSDLNTKAKPGSKADPDRTEDDLVFRKGDIDARTQERALAAMQGRAPDDRVLGNNMFVATLKDGEKGENVPAVTQKNPSRDKLIAGFMKAGREPEEPKPSATIPGDPNGPRYQRPPLTEDTTPSGDGKAPSDKGLSGDLSFDPNSFEKKLDARAKARQPTRASELQGLLDEYNKLTTANNERLRSVGNTAAIMRGNDGANYYKSFAEPIDRERNQFFERQKLGDSQIKLMAERERNDPNSEISRQTTAAVNKMFGLNIPEGVISAAEHDKFFQIPKTYQANVVKEETTKQNNETKKDIKDKDRAAADERAKNHEQHADSRTGTMAGAQIESAKIGSATQIKKADMDQISKGEAGARGARFDVSVQQRVKSLSPVMAQAVGAPAGHEFWVPKEGIIPTKPQEDRFDKVRSESAKYMEDIYQLKKVIQDIRDNGGITDTDAYLKLDSSVSEAINQNVKVSGNGVANYADLAQAVKRLGDPSSWKHIMTFQKYSDTKLDQALKQQGAIIRAEGDADGFTTGSAADRKKYLDANLKFNGTGGFGSSSVKTGALNDEEAAAINKKLDLPPPTPRGGKADKGPTAQEILEKYGKKKAVK